MKHIFSNREVIKEGWKLFKANWKLVVSLGIVTILAETLVRGVQQGLVDSSPFLAFVLSLAAVLLSVIIGLGWSKTSLSLIRSHSATWETFKTDPKLWLQSIKAGLWLILYTLKNTAIAVIPGAVLGIAGYLVQTEWLTVLGAAFAIVGFVAVAIYMGVKYQFVSYVVIDHPSIPSRDIFKRSGTLTEKNWWKVFGFTVVTGLVILLGFLCALVGLVAAVPTVMLAKAKAYDALKSHHETGSASSNE